MKEYNEFQQKGNVTITFSTTVGTSSEEPEEGRDIIASDLDFHVKELKELYPDAEIHIETEVV